MEMTEPTSESPSAAPLTLKQIAQYFQVSPATVRRQCKQGLPFFKVGGQLRFHLDEVRAFFRAHG